MAIATDCKSVLFGVHWFESNLPHIKTKRSGSSSFGRAIAFQAIGGGFEPRLPLRDNTSKRKVRAGVIPTTGMRFSKTERHLSRSSSVVERFLGKEEVTSPTLVYGSFLMQKNEDGYTHSPSLDVKKIFLTLI